MNIKQIHKLAKDSIKPGPVIAYDDNDNGYLAYVVFVREGLRYCTIVIDKDIVDLSGNKMKFMVSEIKAAVECMNSTLLSQTSIEDNQGMRAQ